MKDICQPYYYYEQCLSKDSNDHTEGCKGLKKTEDVTI